MPMAKQLIGNIFHGISKNTLSAFSGSFGTVHRADWHGSVSISLI